MKRILVLTALLFITNTYAAENLKNLEINFDNYYAKIKINKKTVKFEDPYLEQVIRIRRCNRTAFNNLLASLAEETKDYELLVNTKKLPNADDDIIIKRNDTKLRVTSTTSLGSWSRKISDHWNDLVAISKKNCER